MKKSLVFGLLAAFLMVSLPALAEGDQPANTAKVNQNKDRAESRKRQPSVRRAFHTCKSIPDAERKGFRTKQEGFRKEMRADKSLTREQKREKMKEHRQAMEGEMQQMLQKYNCKT